MWCCFIFYFLVLHTHTTFHLCSDTDDAAYAFVIDGNEMFHLNITQKELVMRLPESTSVMDCPYCLSIALSAITACRKNLNTTLKADNYPATHGTLFQSKFFATWHSAGTWLYQQGLCAVFPALDHLWHQEAPESEKGSIQRGWQGEEPEAGQGGI